MDDNHYATSIAQQLVSNHFDPKFPNVIPASWFSPYLYVKFGRLEESVSETIGDDSVLARKEDRKESVSQETIVEDSVLA
jgi:hypothetical protein